MAETTMEAIKKKMQAMRLEKESAFDRADHLEHRLLEQRYIYDKVHSVRVYCHRHRRRRGSTVVISHQIGPNAAAMASRRLSLRSGLAVSTPSPLHSPISIPVSFPPIPPLSFPSP